tara:strand:+ start:789 stop:1346 length:558 start_codon:yes stop_codon:yes gene_type:complete
MSYFSEKETDTIFKLLLMFENIANQLKKNNNSNYKVSNMDGIIIDISNKSLNNKLMINDKLDIRFIENEAKLPSISNSTSCSSERKYETLITDPWDTNRNICSKSMKGERKYVSQAIYEKKLRNLVTARSIKQKKYRENKAKKEEKQKIQSGMVSKRRRKSTQHWDPSVSTKWSSKNNDFILLDF